ncbi:MAG: homoserine O-succinyltransferase [Treponema sp.]|nr:homoserine O-succinyltransferase [Spirochaetia bacterium]MDD7458888.1 homoserine O-succinyltransferase [Spirochaetales bacterium]MDY5810467.1 homoserine O-succinyltransferase [Treponema sp.]MEE1181247.1 homoserine O-succinyltransferase [Treponema sp.]
MPIKIDADLPARSTLENENIFVMTQERAASQDIRPLKIAIVNLMPTKEVTETQLLRLLSNTPLQIDISLVHMENHVSKNTDKSHLDKFYITSEELFKTRFDGMIVTGAPVEQLPFEEVDYWNELCKIMDYAKENVFCTLYICWGAMAGLYHLYNIDKHVVEKKYSGIFYSKLLNPKEPLMRGFDDWFPVPTSRYTYIKTEDVLADDRLELLAFSNETGLTMAKSKDNRSIFMTGHLEYDPETLANEYKRDLDKGINPSLPENYFTDNNPEKPIVSKWRSTAHLFYSNWLNYYVYQTTPYRLDSMKNE